MSAYLTSKTSLVCNSLKTRDLPSGGSSSVCAQCLKRPGKKLFDFLKKLLTTAVLCSTVGIRGSTMTIRESILSELHRRKWSHYRLVKEVEGKIPERTVYSYLSGERDLTSNRASVLLHALGLQIKRKSGQRPRR